MRMDSLQKSFLPMWQEETLAKVSRKLDIIDEDDEQKVGQAKQLCSYQLLEYQTDMRRCRFDIINLGQCSART